MDKTMTRVYVFDDTNRTHELVNAFDVKQGTQLNSNQTTIAPDNGRFFNGVAWTDNLVTIYSYDGDGYLIAGPIKIPENTPLSANETTLAPDKDMYKPKFVGGRWVESFAPNDQSDSTAQQQQINASVMVDMLALKQANAAQAKINAALMMDNMQLKATVANKLTAQVATPAESNTQSESASQSTSVSASESQVQPTAPSTGPVTDDPDATATTADTSVQG